MTSQCGFRFFRPTENPRAFHPQRRSKKNPIVGIEEISSLSLLTSSPTEHSSSLKISFFRNLTSLPWRGRFQGWLIIVFLL